MVVLPVAIVAGFGVGFGVGVGVWRVVVLVLVLALVVTGWWLRVGQLRRLEVLRALGRS